jgi:hypothetical protein
VAAAAVGRRLQDSARGPSNHSTMRTTRVVLTLLLVVGLVPAASAAASSDAAVEGALRALADPSTDGTSSPNMAHVANLQWDGSLRDAERTVPDSQGGTDVEFATIDGRDYAVAGTYRNGLQIIDITDPEVPVLVSSYDCRVLQGDVQLLTREEPDGAGGTETRHYATYAVEGGTANTRDSACFRDIGLPASNGTLFIDITDPAAPRSVGMAVISGGTHNQTVHPGGEYMYNSNSGGCGGCIEVLDIRDPANPVEVARIPSTSLTGEDSHDITFSADGTRAYSAAIDVTMILDTTDPAAPTVISSIVDPAITLHHQSDPVTVGDRTFVVINDELNGAAGNQVCPGGGLHIWEVTGEMESDPQKVGAFFTPEVTVADGAPTGTSGLITCTSHVFRIDDVQDKLVIGWFGAGVRVLDLSGLADVPVAASAGVTGQSVGVGVREVGFFRFPDSDTWSAKVMRWEEDGSAHVFAVDQTRGFDVYRYDATAPAAVDGGRWLTPLQAEQQLTDLVSAGFVPDRALVCDLRLGELATRGA